MRFKTTSKIILVAAILAVFSGSIVFAEEAVPTASASVSTLSKYVWRGNDLSGDGIIVQPSLTLAYKGFAINSWSSLDSDVNDIAAWTETDLTLSYDTKVGAVGLGAGYIYYGLDGADDTKEFYLKASYDTLFTPTLTMYKDIDSFPGYYFSLGLSRSFNVAEGISLGLSGAFGYYISNTDKMLEAGTNKKYNGFQDGLLSATLNIPAAKYITISPTVSYAFPLSGKAKDFLLGEDSNKLFGGVVLSFAF